MRCIVVGGRLGWGDGDENSCWDIWIDMAVCFLRRFYPVFSVIDFKTLFRRFTGICIDYDKRYYLWLDNRNLTIFIFYYIYN